MYNAPSKTTGREQVDVTGLIGQYAHGNEPSHHMAYLYNYIGKSEKTKEKVHYILNNFYTNTPDGLIGNEDCGQMSAWYVLSSLGLYDVTPGDSYWDSTEPMYPNAIFNLDGKSINTKLLGLNDISEKRFKDKYVPYVTVPVIEAEGKSFKDRMKITLSSANKQDRIYFITASERDKTKDKTFMLYTAPFEIDITSGVTAFAENDGNTSKSVSASFFKKPNDYNITIKSKYNRAYHAGGSEGLLDGIHGDENWRKGEWQGYQSQDFEAVVDLKKKTEIHSISANFLQDSRSWILMPKRVEYYTSDDNVNFKLLKTIDNIIGAMDNNVQVKPFIAHANASARYVKVIAYNYGALPEGHQGYGGDAFIFIDEITVN